MNVIKKIFIALIIVLIGGLIFLQFKFKNEITSAVNNSLPPNIRLEYKDINTNILTGSVELDSINFKVYNAEDTLQTSFSSNKLNIKGLSLWKYLIDKKIAINNITINNPKLQHFKDESAKTKAYDSSKSNTFDKVIIIDKISVTNGFIQVNKNNRDSLFTKIDSINFTLKNLSTDVKKLKGNKPFTYSDIQFSSKEIFINMNPYETVRIENSNFNTNTFNLQNLYIEPKFTKETLSTKIAVERDHLQLHIPQLELNKLDFGFATDKFFVTVDNGKIMKPNLSVYRDKRVADDLTIKKLYSKALRDLSFDLTISELKIEQGYISYSQRLEDTNKAGELFFNNVNASLTNLSNTYKNNEKTNVSINSYFMGKAPMRLDISFDVNDKNDTFLASGQFQNFDAEIANKFFESNLNAKIEGEFEQIYFTFDGNNTSSKGDLKMKYNEFKFEILTKKNKVNKLLTTIGNLFVNKGSKADENGFRHGNIEVERNKNKSFFNYLWINVEDGLISTLTGDGEKE